MMWGVFMAEYKAIIEIQVKLILVLWICIRDVSSGALK